LTCPAREALLVVIAGIPFRSLRNYKYLHLQKHFGEVYPRTKLEDEMENIARFGDNLRKARKEKPARLTGVLLETQVSCDHKMLRKCEKKSSLHYVKKDVFGSRRRNIMSRSKQTSTNSSSSQSFRRFTSAGFQDSELIQKAQTLYGSLMAINLSGRIIGLDLSRRFTT